MEKKEFAAVDLFKMICAVLVIFIHTKPFENNFWLDAGVGMITRFAVPYFFTISGYFLFKKLMGGGTKQYWKTLGRYLLRLLRFYIIWFILLRIIDLIFGGSTIQSFRYYIKQFFFTTDGSALWFVEALIWAVLIVAVLTRWIKTQTVFAISIIFLFIGYFFSTLYGITGKWQIVQTLHPIISHTGIQGGLFFAFPYVAMGALLAEKPLEPAYKRDAGFVFLLFVLLGIESLVMVRRFNAPLTFLWIAALPMTWFTTRLTLTIQMKNKPVYYILRKISTLCYVLHIVIFKILQNVFDSSGFTAKDPAHLALTALTLFITIVLAYGIYLLSRKKAFTWLKYIM